MTGSLPRAVTGGIEETGGAIRRAWQHFLAISRLSLRAVCAESARLGRFDYHTYADDVDCVPWGTVGGARCRRCGKRFRL